MHHSLKEKALQKQLDLQTQYISDLESSLASAKLLIQTQETLITELLKQSPPN